MEIKEIRELTGLSQTAFGNKYNIPMRTIQNWETGQRKCPVYVEELLEFKVRYDIELIKIKEITDEDLENFNRILKNVNLSIL